LHPLALQNVPKFGPDRQFFDEMESGMHRLVGAKELFPTDLVLAILKKDEKVAASGAITGIERSIFRVFAGLFDEGAFKA
jgi:hypothetical protein